ncbi:MAG TPA: DUF3093 domain-containing protein [Actinomycetales bacterium]|nr:DUF3093 domain-containing protein [Actinomycetales bacterium]
MTTSWLYRERLWPSGWVWLVVLLVAASSGLVVVKVAAIWVSVVIALVVMALAAWGLVRSSARVEVTGDELVAGRAHIPVALLGTATVLGSTDFVRRRGPDADVRAYLCQRSWITQGVEVTVVDDEDPTPYWLISSRDPKGLAAALDEARREPPNGPESGGSRSRRSGEGSGEGSGQAHSRQTG